MTHGRKITSATRMVVLQLLRVSHDLRILRDSLRVVSVPGSTTLHQQGPSATDDGEWCERPPGCPPGRTDPLTLSEHMNRIATGKARPEETSWDVDEVSALARALADPTRLRVMRLLAEGERCVCDLTEALSVAQSRLSYHLQILKDAGVVADRPEGRWVYYAVVPEVFSPISDMIRQVESRWESYGQTQRPRRC
jgi:ArsR family transcriptional regulator, arsenate/arsenite/antimonite-responsive transcriptional repressor